MILDAERAASRMTEPRPADPRQYLLAFYPDAAIPPLERRAPTAPPLAARINHGQWIVSCPCGARGAPSPGMAAWLSIPWMWCIRCRNAAVSDAWRPVRIPPAELRDRLEAVLEIRADVADRNWEPDETLEELVAQNRDNGDGVPSTEGA